MSQTNLRELTSETDSVSSKEAQVQSEPHSLTEIKSFFKVLNQQNKEATAKKLD